MVDSDEGVVYLFLRNAVYRLVKCMERLGLACRFIGIDFLGKACWWLRRGSMLIVKARKQNLMRVPK